MANSALAQSLKNFYENCISLQKIIAASEVTQITNADLKNRLNQLAMEWFENYSKKLLPFGYKKDTLLKYDTAFKAILKLSIKNNRKSSYESQLNVITKAFLDEIVIFFQTDAFDYDESTTMEFSNEVASLLDKVSDKEENEYLAEALGCWEHGFLKGAVVLAWCSAIDRIHKVIAQKGFDTFNKTSEEMKAQTSGRFKKFNKNQNVNSISDLRMVFDSDILWILEGMKMIDTNQKTRLSSCFDMRCHSGHPGSAPITKYNVISCFSDIIEIILANPLFSCSDNEEN